MLDISLIATDVRSDAEVAELLDLDVNYAQGPLFIAGALNQPRNAVEGTKAKAPVKPAAKRTPSRRRATPAKADADTIAPRKSTRSRASETKPDRKSVG